MSSSFENAVAERVTNPEAPPPAGEPQGEAAKPATVKEKKPRVPKSHASSPSHPTYFQMVKEALTATKEKGGVSPYAIAKFMESKYKSVLPANYKKMLTVQLRNCVAKGKLVKVKGSFKLSEGGQKAKGAAAPSVLKKSKSGVSGSKGGKKVKPVKAGAKEGRAKRKKPTPSVKSKGGKKRSSATAKSKHPKSIKSPAKRARKARAAT